MRDQAGGDNDLANTVVELVRSGQVSSRRDVADHLGVPPATVTLAIKRLLRDEVLVEEGEGPSTGGRRPKLLRLRDEHGAYACAELGARHASYGLVDASGRLIDSGEISIEIEVGHEEIFGTLRRCWDELLSGSDRELRAVAVAFPGPVDADAGVVVSPARMPGWGGTEPLSLLAKEFGVPAVIENDARAGAIGEACLRGRDLDSFLYVKAGMGIGGAWVNNGVLFRGGHGLAGEITHNQLPGVHTEQGCSCGNRSCLELVASGAALCRQLAEHGIVVSSTRALVDLARDAHPEASTKVRAAGVLLGQTIAPLVNFLNPDGVIIGGGLGVSDAFVASIRGALYDRCLPMCTQGLVIETSVAGADAALIGLGELARRRLREGSQP